MLAYILVKIEWLLLLQYGVSCTVSNIKSFFDRASVGGQKAGLERPAITQHVPERKGGKKTDTYPLF